MVVSGNAYEFNLSSLLSGLLTAFPMPCLEPQVVQTSYKGSLSYVSASDRLLDLTRRSVTLHANDLRRGALNTLNLSHIARKGSHIDRTKLKEHVDL